MLQSCSLSLNSRVAFSVVTCLLYFFSQWFEPILGGFFIRASISTSWGAVRKMPKKY
jgi:hypothetical protein